MKDFADIPNSSGAFPNVIAVNCSGPGETDGTALIAETLSDDWGWKQALLNEIGETPDGFSEEGGSSQLVNAFKTLLRTMLGNHAIPMTDGESIEAGGWLYSTVGGVWETDTNFGYMNFPIKLPDGLDAKTVYVDLYINPGAARSSTNRMLVEVYEKTYPDTVSAVIASAYDDATGGIQTVTVSFPATTANTGEYFLRVRGGNDAGTNKDTISGGRVRFT